MRSSKEDLNRHLATLDSDRAGMKKSVEAAKPLHVSLKADVDDLHRIGQKPITFLRQVVALVTCPDLLSNSEFPKDAKQRAHRILSGCYGNSIGSYSEGPGVSIIRNDVAEYVTKRDKGIVSEADNVFLSAGAADALDSLLVMMSTEQEFPNQSGIMIPAPGYPPLRDTVTHLNSYPIAYFLDESNDWDITIGELKAAIEAAHGLCQPRAIVVVNPNNPTGQVLSKKSIENVIKFAAEENLFVIADEVYQNSVYGSGETFHSFKETLTLMGKPYEEMELASLMSASKGLASEAGFRGGACEVINLDPEVKEQLLKVISAKSCSTVPGQVAMDVLVNPPLPEEPSYTLYQEETQSILRSYRDQAILANDVLNSIDGMSCVLPTGSTFVFPRIHLPAEAVNDAKAKGMTPDELYCYHLQQETGIAVRPGSVFGQREGHYHFRLSFMQSPIQMKSLLQTLKDFHVKFWSPCFR